MDAPPGANNSTSGRRLHMSELQSYLAGLLSQVLAEQIKQTVILQRIATQQTQLITALAEEGIEQDPESEPQTYMSGAPRHPA